MQPKVYQPKHWDPSVSALALQQVPKKPQQAQSARGPTMASRFGTWWQKIKSGLRWLWQKIQQHPFDTGIIVVLFLIAFTFGAYQFRWDWTGLTSVKGPQLNPNEQYRPAKTLWDVLQILIIPIMLAIGGFWLNRIQKDREEKATQRRVTAELGQKVKEKKQEERAEQKLLLRKLYLDIVQAYNTAKRVRRLLRATARCLSPDQEVMITIDPYVKQMQALIDVQLQFETFKDEVDSSPTLFSEKAEKADPVTLKNKLGSIEGYLHGIIGEYEKLYAMRPNDTPTLPISQMPRLGEFIEKNSKKPLNKNDFKTKFQYPAHDVKGAILNNLLTSE